MNAHETDLEARPTEREALAVIHHPAAAAGPDRTDHNLNDAVATVATEIGRTDNKASLFSELLGSRGGRWRSFIRTRRFGNQFGWLCVRALRSDRALAGRGFPRNPVESQRPEVVGSCSMLR
ncbi:hypothetical protein [Streptomyces marianii]|uniref:Uncharacterized protein n=1 Tax=Streptomyces marianii TaxID=1817406 RepID=A0A5R9DSX6_9ACTN|nr:hypothetical protein [Streptomyces marianii]TLQ38739.1 hypothetical protein FEF34_40580 [Streptomyces marianii]